MALTADVHIPHKGTPTKVAIPAIGADTFFAGALVYADDANGKVQAVPAAGDVFLGIVAKQVVATAANDLVEVYVDGIHALAYGSAAEGDQSASICLNIGTTQSDDEGDMSALDLAGLATDDILIGKMIAMNAEETSRAWVRLIPGFKWEDTDKAWT